MGMCTALLGEAFGGAENIQIPVNEGKHWRMSWVLLVCFSRQMSRLQWTGGTDVSHRETCEMGNKSSLPYWHYFGNNLPTLRVATMSEGQ